MHLLALGTIPAVVYLMKLASSSLHDVVHGRMLLDDGDD